MKERTTIQIEKVVLKELKDSKKYKRETYSDLIKRMIEKDKKLVGG